MSEGKAITMRLARRPDHVATLWDHVSELGPDSDISNALSHVLFALETLEKNCADQSLDYYAYKPLFKDAEATRNERDRLRAKVERLMLEMVRIREATRRGRNV